MRQTPTFLLSIVCASQVAAAAPIGEKPYQGLAITSAPSATPLRSGGASVLRYEIYLTNFGKREARLKSIDVLADGAPFMRLDVPSIVRSISGGDGPRSATIAPGYTSVAYIDVPMPHNGATRLTHRVAYGMVDGNASGDVTVTGGSVAVIASDARTLGAPLRGGPWVAVYDPDMDMGHRRYVYAVSGEARIPGRFAVDWMPARGFAPRSAGRAASTDGTGADVLAVADATVAAVRRERTAKDHAGVESEVGNAIVLDLGRGRFAFYEHLAGDTELRVGDRVARGQVIGRLGSSGHVTQAHLHFHVANGPGFLSAERLPYRMSAGRSVGRYASISEYRPSAPWDQTLPAAVDFPRPMQVVIFD